MAYKILHHRLFEKEIVKIPAHHQKKVYQVVTQLGIDPGKLPANTLPLSGYKGVYRTRIGDWRLIYQVNHAEKQVLVLGIAPRARVYRMVERVMGK